MFPLTILPHLRQNPPDYLLHRAMGRLKSRALHLAEVPSSTVNLSTAAVKAWTGAACTMAMLALACHLAR